jgi:enolase
MVKWNEVIRIERALGSNARFLGAKIFQETLGAAGGFPR